MSLQAQATESRTEERFPRGALIGAAAVLSFALLFTALARLEVIGQAPAPERHAENSRALLFEDSASGEVLVRDAGDGQTVAVLPQGGDGFLRATMRGLAQERLSRGLSHDLPFELTLWETGGLTLIDPATGREIALEAFGPTNAGAFARFLQPQGGKQ